MNILQIDNTAFDMNVFPDTAVLESQEFNEIDDLRYCVLDYSNPNSADGVDFIFIPLIFLDQFSRPSADLQIGPHRIQVPLDWSIVIADKDFGHMEIIELKSINDRPFQAFIMNPLTSYMPDFGEITIQNVFPDVTWTMPKLKFGHILAVPLNDSPSPPCVFCIRETTRLPEVLDITKIFC